MSLTQRFKSRFKGKGIAEDGSSGPGFPKKVEEERSGLFMFTKNTPTRDYTVDIVAVHGLGGHWEETWTHDNGKLWLRDFLPSQLREASIDARIMSFGYNSDTFTSKAVSGIDQEAGVLLDRLEGKREEGQAKTRPLIFIAHSLGGLVVKKAMIIAWEKSHIYENLYTSIRGCIFLGVPHRGADTAFWASFPANLAKIGMLGFRGNTRYLDALKRSSKTWRDISRQFVNRAAQLKIRTFYETEKVDNMLIVDEDSACLGLPNELALALACSNHKTMCKFNSSDSQRYEPLWISIRKLALEIKHGQSANAPISSRPEINKVHFMVHFLRNQDFVSRDDVMDELEGRLSRPKQHHRVAITGIGGAGKTQIALEFCYMYREKHPSTSIFWIYAGGATSFSQSCSNIADILDLPRRKDPQVDILQIVGDHFSHEDCGPWLLVVDNADNQELFFDSNALDGTQFFTFLPRNTKGSIIFTSRNLKTASKLTDSGLPISVDKMSLEAARELLEKNMPSTPYVEQENALLEELERLPLAIKQAAAFMVENTMDIQIYLKLFEKESSKLLSKEFRDAERYSGVSNATMVTWIISFEQIKNIRSAAAELLAIMSFYDRQGIPKSLLAHGQKSMLDFEEALGTLKAFSLVQSSDEGETYGMHRLVKMAMKCWLDEHGQLRHYGERAIELISESFPTWGWTASTECGKFFPHAQAVLGTEAAFRGSALKRASLLARVSRYLIHRGLFPLAQAMYQECVHIRETELGTDRRATIGAQMGLAFCLVETGSAGEAETILRQAQKACENSSEADDELLNDVRMQLAQCIAREGAEQDHEAEDLVRSVMDSMGLMEYKARNEVELKVLEFLGVVLSKGGKAEAAAEFRRQILDASERLRGPTHPETLDLVHNLAYDLETLGRYKEAEKLASRAMKSKLEIFGKDHINTWDSATLLGSILYAQDKFDAAVKIYKQALEGQEKLLEPINPDTLVSVHNLALGLEKLGRYEEAEQLASRAMTSRLEVLGKDDENTWFSARLLEDLLHLQGKEASADVIRLCNGVIWRDDRTVVLESSPDENDS